MRGGARNEVSVPMKHDSERRNHMMKLRVFSGVVVGMALIAASPVLSHAGGGGVGTTIPAGSGLFNCYMLQGGPNSPFVVTVTDENGTQQHVKLGSARLLCTPTGDLTVEHGPVPNPNFDVNQADHVKCYDVTAPNGLGPLATVTVSDQFVSELVSVGLFKVLCGPAQVTP
jgi:hypothetical protein